MNEFEEIGTRSSNPRAHGAHRTPEHFGRFLIAETHHLGEHEGLAPIAIEFDEQRLDLLALDVLVLGYVGGAEANARNVILGQIASAYYFAHFLIILPWVARSAGTEPNPTRRLIVGPHVRLVANPMRRPSAASFVRRIRKDARAIVASFTDSYQYTIDRLIARVIERCRELNLRLTESEEESRTDFLVFLTVQTMNYLHSGRHRMAV